MNKHLYFKCGLLFFMSLMGISMNLFGQTNSGSESTGNNADREKAIAIVKKAFELTYQAKTTYCESESVDSQQRETVKKFIKKENDTTYEREEFTDFYPKTAKTLIWTNVTNKDEKFSIIDNKFVILKKFKTAEDKELQDAQKKIDEFIKNFFKNLPDSCVYKIKDIKYNGLDCYKVTINFSDEFRRKVLSFKHEILDPLVATHPYLKEWFNQEYAVYESIVSKDNSYTYSEKVYLNNGGLSINNNYTKMELNQPISDDLFVVPKDMPVFTATSEEELNQIAEKNRKNEVTKK